LVQWEVALTTGVAAIRAGDESVERDRDVVDELAQDLGSSAAVAMEALQRCEAGDQRRRSVGWTRARSERPSARSLSQSREARVLADALQTVALGEDQPADERSAAYLWRLSRKPPAEAALFV